MAAPLEPFIVALLLGITLAAFLVAIFQKDYVRAVIAFAAGSAFVAALFAYLGAPFAAVLELTAGAGLTAVLFLVAITLTRGTEEDAHG